MLLAKTGVEATILEKQPRGGGGTHPGSGLPVIFESARISSKLLLEDLN